MAWEYQDSRNIFGWASELFRLLICRCNRLCLSHHALLLFLVLRQHRHTSIDWDKIIWHAEYEARNSSLSFLSLSATACSLSLFNVAAATQLLFFSFRTTITRWLTQISPVEVTCRRQNVWKTPGPHFDGRRRRLLFLSAQAAG